MKMSQDLKTSVITTATEATTKEQHQHQQQQQQQQFNLETETRNNVIAELEEINKQYQQLQLHQLQQQDSNTNSTKNRFLKFSDGQRRRLAFMDFERKPVQNKDFATGELISDSYSTRYFFTVVDVTDPDNPVEGKWERGPKEAKTILFWLSKNYKVLDVERHGKAGDKLTTYNIYPAVEEQR